MTTENKDPFAYRNEGGWIKIGDKEDLGISAMINTGDSLLVVTRKGIYTPILADSVDPERTNSAIPKQSQQKILSYGSDELFVGRTLLQAQALFGEQGLPSTIDCKKGLNIGLAFLKEITALHELANDYITEEDKANLSFKGKLEEDQSLHLPTIHKLEQRTKQFINNSDYAILHLIEMAQLFYPDITKNNKKRGKIWAEQLQEKFEKEKGPTDPSTKFAGGLVSWLKLIRSLRNAIEHTTTGAELDIQDYSLNKEGHVRPPILSHIDPKTPLHEMLISKFMANTLERLQTSFETLMAHLCNIHAEPFAGDVRSVIQFEIPRINSSPDKTHVRFEYYIAWTR
ncbi:MAG: hypothetical protein WDK96_01470 [Candidatus Paceibacterota bacterium]|jgi:hypothetical protein